MLFALLLAVAAPDQRRELRVMPQNQEGVAVVLEVPVLPARQRAGRHSSDALYRAARLDDALRHRADVWAACNIGDNVL